MVSDRHALATEYVRVKSEIRYGADIDDTNIGDLYSDVLDMLLAPGVSIEDKVDFLRFCCEYAQSDGHVLADVAAGPVEDFLNANAREDALVALEAVARRSPPLARSLCYVWVDLLRSDDQRVRTVWARLSDLADEARRAAGILPD